MKLTIDRTKLNSGSGKNCGVLADSLTQKCCAIGYLAAARGVPVVQMYGVLSLDDVADRVPETEQLILKDPYLQLLIRKGRSHYLASQVASDIVEVNDDYEGTDTERESELTELFATIGVEVEFVN